MIPASRLTPNTRNKTIRAYIDEANAVLDDNNLCGSIANLQSGMIY